MQIGIQGYPGAFHEEAALAYFGNQKIEIIPIDTFDQMAEDLSSAKIDLAIMAIENSIAGSLLQNYRILREHGFWILGEIYLRIRHQLMALRGQDIDEIKEVHSHPMAINQCLKYLNQYPEIKKIATEDTALSAATIAKSDLKGIAGIGSIRAAELYDLEVLASGIETNKYNYTRFFIIQKDRKAIPDDNDFNKASIYLRVADQKGQLLKVLEKIEKQNINISKLQSYPVMGNLREYFFHLDLEFDYYKQFSELYEQLKAVTSDLHLLGVYDKMPLDVILKEKQELHEV